MKAVNQEIAKKKLESIFGVTNFFGFEYWQSYIEVHLLNSNPEYRHLSIVSCSDMEIAIDGYRVRLDGNDRDFLSVLSDLQAKDANKFRLTDDCSLVLSFSDVDLVFKSIVSDPGFEWIEQPWAIYSCNYAIESQRRRELIASFDGEDIYLK